MLKILLLLFVSIYIFYLPGYLITKLAFKKRGYSETFALSIGLSIALIPIILFGIALLLHTTLQKNFVLAITTIINSALLIIILIRHFKKIK